MSVRLSKYEERVREFEEQNERHNELHDRMKQRLKELTLKLEEQRDSVRLNHFCCILLDLIEFFYA